MLNENDKAPNFKLENQDGKLCKLSDYKDKKLVLYFYPKDDTPGCTKEACSLRDGISKLKRNGFVVIGISPDSVQKHRKFADKYGLQFDLLADEEKTALAAYGVWQQKSMFGKKYMGVVRTTFLIEKGKIKHVFKKINVSEHADQILEVG